MNILELIKDGKYYVNINSEFQKLLAENYKFCTKPTKINASNETIKRILYVKNYYTSIDTLISLCQELSIPVNRAYVSIKFIKTKMSFPIPLKKFEVNKEFMRILGHILGDGGIHVIEREGKHRAFYVNNEQTLLDSFYHDIKHIFGEVQIYHRARKNHGDEIWLPTSIGFIIYSILNYKKLNKKKRIPSWIFNINNRALLGVFLQALYDDEGYIYPKKNMIVIAQKSKDLINDIRKIVIKLGIEPNQLLIQKSKERTLMNYFSITHKNNIKKFNSFIGFMHPIKKHKLKMLMNKYKEK